MPKPNTAKIRSRQSRKRNRLAALFTAAALGIGLGAYEFSNDNGPELSYDQFLDNIKTHQVADVVIKGDTLTGHFSRTGKPFHLVIPDRHDAVPDLKGKGVTIHAQPKENPFQNYFFSTVLPPLIPILFIIPAIIGATWLAVKMQSGTLTKRKGSGVLREIPDVTFDDVAGMEETKEDVGEMVDFLKDPEKFKKLGSKIPRGILLSGPPGNGKTLLARAIAGTARVPFFSASGSDFVEMFVGRGAARVRDLFEQAKKEAPCIIFIDEIDALGKQRSSGPGNGGSDEREQTLNQLLVELDGFGPSENIIIIGATNRPDILDPALRRPGRFDRESTVALPDLKARMAILGVHMKAVNKEAGRDVFDSSLDLEAIARGTPGFSGADLSGLINEATLLAGRKGKDTIGKQDIEDARDKVMLGPELRSRVITGDMKNRVAYHEAAHAVVAHFMPGSQPVHKATIIPRTRSYGHVMRLPEDGLETIRKLKADLAVAAAGRIGEEMFYGDPEDVSTGAAGDIEQLTSTAWKMVAEWGMDKDLGMIRYGSMVQNAFNPNGRSMSEETAREVDAAVRKLADTAMDAARTILNDHRQAWENLAMSLLARETLDGAEVAAIIDRAAPASPAPEHPGVG